MGLVLQLWRQCFFVGLGWGGASEVRMGPRGVIEVEPLGNGALAAPSSKEGLHCQTGQEGPSWRLDWFGKFGGQSHAAARTDRSKSADGMLTAAVSMLSDPAVMNLRNATNIV